MIMPIGGRGQMMYIPDGNDGPSGPWTMTDTKIAIAICIIFFVITLLSVIIEWQFAKKKLTLKEYLLEVIQCGLSSNYMCYELSVFTTFMTLIFYVVFVLATICFGVYGLINIM